MGNYKFGWNPTEEDLRWIRETKICDREALLAAVRERQARARQAAGTDRRHSAAYYTRLDSLFNRFYDALGELVLFEQLEPCWCYDFSVNSRGARLNLRHIGWMDQRGEGSDHSLMYNAEYELLTVSCNMISVEEFAEINEVERGTVLQWIRRGKIRSIRRVGKHWRISELTELPGRKYNPVGFQWAEGLTELTELTPEYDFLLAPGSVYISQDPKDPLKFNLTIFREDQDPKAETKTERREGLTIQKREKLELALLSHPLVTCRPENETSW